jgi:ABC-type lipoprotein release transport system permease subunit
VAPDDAATYGLVLVIVVAAVTLAAYLPARRAVVADPQAILRQG